MTKKITLPPKVIKLVKGNEWYHQRFDGAPMYMYCVAEAEIKPEARKPKGTEAKMRVSFFMPNGRGDWYLDMADVKRGAQIIIDLAKKDALISRKLLKAWRKDEELFEKFFYRFEASSLGKLMDKDLLALYKQYYKLFVNRFTSSAIIDHFALGTDEYIANILRKEMGKIKKESEFTEIFSIATAPTKQSFINESEMKLLALALKPHLSAKDLQNYQKDYFWIKNNYYQARNLTVTDFKKEISIWKKSGANLTAKYWQLKNASRMNARKKNILFKKYKLSKLLRTLLKISDDFTWWQDERKKSTYLNIHIGSCILGEMAKRRGYNPEVMKYLLPVEVGSMFLKGIPSAQELKNRQKGCAFVVWHGGFYVATGKQVTVLRNLMFSSKNKDEVKDLRGLTASVGRVIGPVKVVNSVREISKVKKGDILVAVMTRPDYIVGIKKAAAIVTNEGGITCHAAIVARELGIPCIIATKIATEVLHDGDLVEVNANHGVVTVLKRK
ncbi:MAG: PEP-utilizing enzyme [Patescibacteria group bacterium]